MATSNGLELGEGAVKGGWYKHLVGNALRVLIAEGVGTWTPAKLSICGKTTKKLGFEFQSKQRF